MGHVRLSVRGGHANKSPEMRWSPRGGGPGSLHAWLRHGRNYRHLSHLCHRGSCTESARREKSANPCIRITVGEPLPVQYSWSRYPPMSTRRPSGSGSSRYGPALSEQARSLYKHERAKGRGKLESAQPFEVWRPRCIASSRMLSSMTSDQYRIMVILARSGSLSAEGSPGFG